MGIIIWLEEQWPKSTIFLALYGALFLLLFAADEGAALLLLWLQLPVYWLHQFEEYVYPGGFVAVFNTQMLGSSRTDWPLTKRESLWINLPLIYVAFPLAAILAGSAGLAWGLWIAYFSVLNALSHVGMAFRLGYNPGLVVSLLLNIPVGAFTIWYFATNDLVSGSTHLVSLLVSLAVQGGLMVWGLKYLRARAAAERK